MEIYAAVAKAGLVMVPINFRLVGPEVQYIIENSEAKAVIVQDDLLDRLETVRAERLIAEDKYIHFGGRTPAGYRSYEDLVAAGALSEPSIETGPDDPYALLYTSGTTGKPKGVIRDSSGLVLQAYLLQADWGFGRNDSGLLVMAMCHANSLYFLTYSPPAERVAASTTAKASSRTISCRRSPATSSPSLRSSRRTTS